MEAGVKYLFSLAPSLVWSAPLSVLFEEVRQLRLPGRADLGDTLVFHS